MPSSQKKPASASRLWSGLVPDALGVALLVVLASGALAIGLLADRTLQGFARQQLEDLRPVTGQLLAAALADEQSEPAALPDNIPDGLTAFTVQRANGASTQRWHRGPAGGFQPAGPDELPTALNQHVTAMPGGGELVTYWNEPLRSTRLGLIAWSSLILLVALGSYLLIYRRLRRHVEPMEAVERNLNALASGVERELYALSLSDSLGSVADSWNHLMQELVDLRSRGESGGGQGDLAGAALQRFETRNLRQVLDRLPIGVLRCRADGHVTYANDCAIGLLRQSTPPTGRSLESVTGEQVATGLLGALQRGATTETIDHQTGSGENDSTLRFRLVRTGDKPDAELLLTLEDVTYIREAERSRDNFLYHVTHELRTPLTNIHAYAETLSRPDFDDETTRKECYNVIISETRRLSALVEDILSVSQMEVGSIRLELADVDIVRLVRELVQDNLAHAEDKQLDLRLTLPPKAPRVRGDKQRLAILINNLVGNAIKYTQATGQIQVSMEAEDGTLRFSVTDSGVGIAPEDQKHIFDKFYRAADDEVQAVSGTGLGLAIAREIARLHGGDITVESTLGKGSTFAVQLPVVPTAVA